MTAEPGPSTVFVLGELVLALATSYLAQNGREGLSRLLRGGVTLAFLAASCGSATG